MFSGLRFRAWRLPPGQCRPARVGPVEIQDASPMPANSDDGTASIRGRTIARIPRNWYAMPIGFSGKARSDAMASLSITAPVAATGAIRC